MRETKRFQGRKVIQLEIGSQWVVMLTTDRGAGVGPSGTQAPTGELPVHAWSRGPCSGHWTCNTGQAKQGFAQRSPCMVSAGSHRCAALARTACSSGCHFVVSVDSRAGCCEGLPQWATAFWPCIKLTHWSPWPGAERLCPSRVVTFWACVVLLIESLPCCYEALP